MWMSVEEKAANGMAIVRHAAEVCFKEAGYVSWQGGKWWERTPTRNGHFDEGMTEGLGRWLPSDDR